LLYSEGSGWYQLNNKNTDTLYYNYGTVTALGNLMNEKGLILSAWNNPVEKCYYLQENSNPLYHLFTSDIFVHSISANGINDIFLVGDFSFAAHYNGVSLKKFNELASMGSFLGSDYLNGKIYMVGASGAEYQAIIVTNQ
jgi:hypothetical protein